MAFLLSRCFVMSKGFGLEVFIFRVRFRWYPLFQRLVAEHHFLRHACLSHLLLHRSNNVSIIPYALCEQEFLSILLKDAILGCFTTQVVYVGLCTSGPGGSNPFAEVRTTD